MHQMNIKNLVQASSKGRKAAAIVFFALAILVLYLSTNFIFLEPNKQQSSALSSQNKTNYLTTLLKNCYKNRSRETCLKQAAQDIYSNFTLEEFSQIVLENEKDEGIFNTCHEASHYIGRIAYEKAKDIGKLFGQCQHICLDGCYHGVIEGYFIEKNIPLENFQIISSEVGTICGKEDDYEVPELYITCLHGLGHAVMFVTDNELPEALLLCDALETEGEEELCYTGALMANMDARKSIDHPSKYIKEDDPMYPCNILPEKHQKKCYEYNTLNFYNFTNYDWKKTIELCGQVPKDFRKGCFETMGGDQVGFTDDIQKIKDECDLIEGEEFKAACFKGAEGNLMMRYSTDFTKPIEFCILMENSYKDGCFKSFIRLLNRWSRDFEKKSAVCTKIREIEYQDRCLNSIK